MKYLKYKRFTTVNKHILTDSRVKVLLIGLANLEFIL